MTSVQVHNLGSASANFYVIFSDSIPKLMVDCGWANSMKRLQAQLADLGITLSQIGHLLVTHYHPDHSGLVKELKSAGLRLVVFETQLPRKAELADPKNLTERYIELQQRDGLIVEANGSRELLLTIGVHGEIISTPGHTYDSITLILDEGIAFTGDLVYEIMIATEDKQSMDSWRRIHEFGVRTVYPGHGKPQQVKQSK
jgi:glyoxylase-like metal-dependent hydrolase (beta-lactamase superfamily II)